jgi:hypothetical protein
MPQQLIFTSAVRGIAPGSSGYCTVARTQDMREGLIARLEQLSVFQHVANGTHPVVLSHRIVNLRNSTFHVLSRIADAGLDYTNRTNFIAHHVVFQPHEIHGGCSPADFLLHWQGWKSEWVDAPSWTNDTSANPHLISQRIILPAKNWEGWASWKCRTLVCHGGYASRSITYCRPWSGECAHLPVRRVTNSCQPAR